MARCVAEMTGVPHNHVAVLNDLAIHELVETKGIAERTGADHVIIFFILDAKSDSGHLFNFAADSFETRGQFEIAEIFSIEDEKGKMFVSCVL